MAEPAATKGIWYATGVPGKYRLRVREEYVAGPAADLISARRYGALKVDLILRGLALLPAVAAPNQPGHVPRHRGRLRYETPARPLPRPDPLLPTQTAPTTAPR